MAINRFFLEFFEKNLFSILFFRKEEKNPKNRA